MPRSVHLSTHLVVVPLEDRAGEMARVTRCLTRAGIDLEGFCVGDSGARFLLHDLPRAASALEAGGFRPRFAEVAALHIDHRPGELARLCEELADAGVNIEQGFGLAVGGEGRIYISVDDLRRAGPVIAARTDVIVVHQGLRRI